MSRFVAWQGIRIAKPSAGGTLLTVVFKFAMAVYLFGCAAVWVRQWTGIPVPVSVLLWFVLAARFGEANKGILTSRQSEIVSLAIVLLGSAYRLSGHPSVLELALICTYWGLVIFAKYRPRK